MTVLAQETVSVVIPTYGHAAYVLAAIESCLQQTRPPSEIIVINDGSPDETESVLAPLIDAGHIRYERQDNQGQAVARNRGLQLARGSLVAFLDDDDWWPLDRLEWQAAYLERNPDVGMIAGSALFVYSSGKERRHIGGVVGEITFESLFYQNPMVSPGQALMRRAVLERVGGFDPGIWGSDDWDVYFGMSRFARVMMADQLALYHRRHSGNSSLNARRMLENGMKVVRKQLQFAPPMRRPVLGWGARRFLFRYRGANECRKAGRALRRMQLARAFEHLGNARCLVPGLAPKA
jgi:glycosyltransferase involved in cell wall biosynthesis